MSVFLDFLDNFILILLLQFITYDMIHDVKKGHKICSINQPWCNVGGVWRLKNNNKRYHIE